MRTAFFENVNTSLKEEIVPPVISTKGYSDFERITYEIKLLKLEVKKIDKKLSNLQMFSNLIVKNLEGKDLSEEEYKEKKTEMLRTIEMDLIEEKNEYLKKIELIKNDPLAYLRFLEFQSSDFSKIENEEVRRNLKQQNSILRGYISERDSWLKKIKKSEKKDNKHSLQLKNTKNKK